MPDPAPVPADPTPTPPAPAPAEPAPADPPNPDPDADDTDPRVKRANAQAANYRTQLREAEAARAAADQAQTDLLARFAAALGGDAPTETDPAQQVQALTTQVETLTAELGTARTELAVHALAADNGGNANALLDSRSFLNTLQGIDATADDYRDKVADAIKSAVASNANLSDTGPAPARGGAPGAGQGSAGTGGVTQEQFNAMNIGERSELFRTDPDTYRRLADSIR